MPLFPWSGGLSFRSPRALAIARSGWILGCMAALGFLPGWEWMFNFLGFFGLIGVAIAMESVHRSRRGGSGASEIATPLFPKSFGLTFRSRLALRIARGGFFLGCLAALGFIPGLRAMFGFAGFFGLLGIAVLIEVVHKLRIAGVPLFVDRDGRRQIYWPGHVMLYSTIGLVAAACCAIIAMFVATADGPATAQSGGAMFICCLLAAMGCGTLHAVAAKRAALDASQLQQAQPSRLRTAATGLGILFSLVIAFALAARFGWLREIALSWMPNPRTVVSQTIQNEVGRQLKAAGATYEDLHVSAADNRDSGTPFAVEYRGLSHFKSAGGTSFTNAAGEFIMAYNGGGQYRGTLRGTQFIVSVGRVDNIDLPFIDDPDAIGEWKSVDFVSDESDFNPGRQRFGGELYFKGVTFLQEGKTPQPWFTWTKGVLIHQGDKTASHYDIQHVNGERYMFLEHKTGDYLFLGKTPMYYVLRWIGPPATQP
jgi:bla regulator protein BlaR1